MTNLNAILKKTDVCSNKAISLKKVLLCLCLSIAFFYDAQAQKTGIDIHKNTIASWDKVAADKSKLRFCYIKATESDYTTSPYANFDTSATALISRNITIGAYHFGTPLFSTGYYQPDYDHPNTVDKEVTSFVTAAQTRIGNGYLPPVLDIEEQIVAYTSDNKPKIYVDVLTGVSHDNAGNTLPKRPAMHAAALAQWIHDWVTQVAAKTKVMPLLYCNRTYADSLYRYFLNGKIPCKLWVADPSHTAGTPANSGWSQWPWVFHQYSKTGAISGITGNVDMDYFAGDENAFLALINQTITQTSTVDLTITPGTQSANTVSAAAGSTITVKCAESNGGNSASGANDVTVWLSTDGQLQPGSDINIGKISFSQVAQNSETLINSSNLVIPANTAPGNYFLFFWADGGQVIPETNETNNFASKTITITAPTQPFGDLVVSNPTISPSGVNAGGTITVSCSNKNQGTGNASASVTSIWLSADQKYDGAPVDTYLGEIAVPAIAAGQSSATLTKQLALPNGPYAGTWYLLFGADGGGSVIESNEANNQVFIPITFGSNNNPAAPVLSLTPGCNGTAAQITLNWSSTSNANSYDIYRNGGLYKSGLKVTQFVSADIIKGQSYSYYIMAQTPTGLLTSNTLSLSAPDCSSTTLPGTPVLTANATCVGTSSQVNLTWAATSNTIAYDIYRNDTYVTTVSSVTNYTDNTVAGGTSYTYYVRSTNGSGGTNSTTQSVTASNCQVALPDAPVLTLAPGCGADATPHIQLTWNATNNTVAYDVYRDNAYQATVSNNTLYVDYSVTGGSTYSYYVRATNGSGGTNSAAQSATATDCSAVFPGKPVLTATALCNAAQSRIVLNWTVDNAILCKIFRNGVAYNGIYGTSGEFDDDAVTPGVTYTYYIQALNNTGSSISDSQSATATDCSSVLPDAPVLTATASCSGPNSQIQLSWTASNNAGSYDIYRNNSLYFADIVNGTGFDDTQVAAGQNYTYYVVAKNTNGSAASAPQTSAAMTCPPDISDFSPVTAIAGTTVTINGDNFNSASQVSFGGVPAKSFTVLSPTSISAVVAGGASGDVNVTTPAGTGSLSGFTYVFSLPPGNFTAYAVSATCHQDADGSIHIKAAQAENYQAQISSGSGNSSITFKDSLFLDKLPADTYHVCITVTGQPGYQQCYDLVVAEPPALTALTTVNPELRTLTLQLDGGQTYLITLNGHNYTTTEKTITLPLNLDDNDLMVTTDKLCQGVIQKHLFLNGRIVPFPDPFQNVLSLDLGNRSVKLMDIVITNIANNKTVYTNHFVQQTGIVQLDVANLNNGAYVLQVVMDGVLSTYKIIKK